MSAFVRIALGAALVSGSTAAAAEIHVTDDLGRSVTLERPARRIVSLAPHITELLFTSGAGDRIVGTVAYSNYPEPAKSIPRVGDSLELDLERIVALRPDLVVVWLHTSERRQLEPLMKLGIPIFYEQPRRLSDIARALEIFGTLAATEAVATRAANEFTAREAGLRRRYADRSPVRVFYQIWDQPLMTINGNDVISEVIGLCGGRNVFSRLEPLVPGISTEAVIHANPEAIVAAEFGARPSRHLDRWKSWPQIEAVARGNLFLIPDDLISRPATRILDGAQIMCEDLQAVRTRRPK